MASLSLHLYILNFESEITMIKKIKYEVSKDQETGDTIILKHQFKVIHEAVFPVLIASCRCYKYDLAGRLIKQDVH